MGFTVGSEDRFGAANRRAAYLLLPLTLVLVATLIVFSLFDTVQVVGSSMVPALEPNDLLLVTDGYAEPARGDVVFLLTREDGHISRLIKRIVALPGDEVRVAGDVVYVNGSAETPYEVLLGPSPVDVGPYIVPVDTVFVAGDNRGVSLDSRFFGPVPLTNVQGRAVAVISPPTHMGAIDSGQGPD